MAVTHAVPATGIVLSDDPAWLPLDQIYRFLSQETYWARGLPRAVFDRSIAHSLCLAAYRLNDDGTHGELAGFARVISTTRPSPTCATSSCCPSGAARASRTR